MSYSICRVDWDIAQPLLKNIREKVFVCEWRIPKKIEFDRQDRQAFHILICDDEKQEPVATGRLLPTGEISRIAVLLAYRKKALDKIVLKQLFKIAKDELKLNEIYINSALEHIDYFCERGFNTQGSVFMEAGIPRQRMTCPVNKANLFKSSLSH